MQNIDIITGEKVQQIAHIYVGDDYDFNYNPIISKQNEKFIHLDKIIQQWDNPKLIFCYSHRLPEFITKIKNIKNKFILLVGNSDYNITLDIFNKLIESDKVHHIFIQNCIFTNSKVSILPIGLANSQWNHGNIPLFNKIEEYSSIKKNDIFCSFKIDTNREKRLNCFESCQNNKITNISYNTQEEYLFNLATSKYAICPEGNGLDTHRFWEALYYKTIPICIKNNLVIKIKNEGIPCILLNSWDELSNININEYNNYVFDESYFYNLSFLKIRNDIMDKLSEIEDQMNVVLSFIGKMPTYIEECIKQLRLFFNGSIYLIYDTIDLELKNKLESLNIIFIHYDIVKSDRFDYISKYKDFCVVDRLEDRRELFKKSYERIYLLENLMLKYNLENVWFMEIDILMYTNPNIFLNELKTKPYAYFYHDKDHCCSAILYVKDYLSLQTIMESLDTYSGNFMSEMKALYYHYTKNTNDYLLPIINVNLKEPNAAWKNFGKCYDYIFDGATKGQYLFGVDKIHTNNKIIRNDGSSLTTHIPFWNYGKFLWYKNNKGLYVPYYKEYNTNNLFPIVNLHIHSKDLISAVSYTEKNL
jgi:hypothetical protein